MLAIVIVESNYRLSTILQPSLAPTQYGGKGDPGIARAFDLTTLGGFRGLSVKMICEVGVNYNILQLKPSNNYY